MHYIVHKRSHGIFGIKATRHVEWDLFCVTEHGEIITKMITENHVYGTGPSCLEVKAPMPALGTVPEGPAERTTLLLLSAPGAHRGTVALPISLFSGPMNQGTGTALEPLGGTL